MSDEPKRITEAELSGIWAALQPTGRDEHAMPERLQALNRPDDDYGHDSVTRALVDEVRRLRGLIVAFTARAEIQVTRFYEGDHEGPDSETDALLTEARAIHEEQNLTPGA